MGRAPCCDKANVKRGPWSPEEDTALKNYVERHGTGGNWIALPHKAGLKRCGKSCRLRWLNYLRPDIKHGGFTEEEDNIICSLYNNIGSRWSVIASHLPRRTDNDVKNYWNTKLKKKLLAGKTSLKSNNGDRNNKTITTDSTICLISTPSPTSIAKVETHNYNFSPSPSINSTALPSMEVVYGQNVANTHTLVSDAARLPLLGLSEISELINTNANENYSVSSSKEASSVSGSSSLALDSNLISWPAGSGGSEDDGFLMDFSFEASYDLPNGFGSQEKTSEIEQILSPNLANFPYSTTLYQNVRI